MRVEKKLNETGSIAKIHEQKTSEITDTVCPTIETNLIVGMLHSQFAAVERALNETHGEVRGYRKGDRAKDVYRLRGA